MSMSEAIADRPLAVSFAKAAELKSVSKASLRRYARDGRLRTVRFGRRRIIPFNALTELLRNGPTLWETGPVKFPSSVAPYGSTTALIEEVKTLIRQYAAVPEEWLEILSLYILMTWVYDRFTAVPYLRFLGEPGTGKTRLLQICASVSYKGIVASGNITGPALFRTIDLVRCENCKKLPTLTTILRR